jgi:hypothetical protein
MSRIRLGAAAVAALVSLALAASALAAVVKVTGGTVTVTPSAAATSLLSTNGITVTPVGKATSSSGAFTFPIAGGRLHTKTLHGVVREQGGLDLSNGTNTIKVRRLTLVSDKAGVTLLAVIRTHPAAACSTLAHLRARVRCRIRTSFRVARIARMTDLSVSNGAATGTVHITAATAAAINDLAGKQVTSAGAVLGTSTVAPTLG